MLLRHASVLPSHGAASQVLMYIPEQVYCVNLLLYHIDTELYVALRVRHADAARQQHSP